MLQGVAVFNNINISGRLRGKLTVNETGWDCGEVFEVEKIGRKIAQVSVVVVHERQGGGM